ncbi:hypothetical protein FNV65_29775 [Streptomyces sp. S1A1-8]|uniref:DUF6284 family protein n=1 Tax=unclassified Streptomyces TaxID=2593676 RepID=UPI0011649775|nr:MULTISPECIES: DUF6284 family protein [unclassified Streptomyces]QDN99837.1 hypothetical protein FNV58_31205 [Streptomyces sp. RLB1-9]QDO21568.1 hypothetical protein FNV65_29775 [Streptomyces sp. S1A1-8]QDO31692.1 hypothetical protein FNV63_29795 [Streptomyces sp. S1A1-3]
MNHIVTVQDAVTAFAPWLEPTDAELDAIEREIPLIRAEVELLDAQISLLDRPVTEVDTRRVRRARRKVLAACLAVTNQTSAVSEVAA